MNVYHPANVLLVLTNVPGFPTTVTDESGRYCSTVGTDPPVRPFPSYVTAHVQFAYTVVFAVIMNVSPTAYVVRVFPTRVYHPENVVFVRTKDPVLAESVTVAPLV
jgi:hypothetical protein